MRLQSTSTFAASCFVLVTACGRQISLGENDGKSSIDAGHDGTSGHDSTSDIDASRFGTGGRAGTNPSGSGVGGIGTAGSSTTDVMGSGSAGAPPAAEPDASRPVACDDGTIASPTELLSAPYQIAPGQEKTFCFQRTATADLDITALRLESPDAIDVTLAQLLPSDDAGADGEVPCSTLSGSDSVLASASSATGGVDAGLTLPAGTAIHVARGERLVLQTHLVDTSAQADSAASIVRATLAPSKKALEPAALPLTLRTGADCVSYEVSLEVPVQLAPGSETIYCARKTLSNAMDIHLVHVDAVPGIHDYQLSIGSPNGPDGVETCTTNTPAESHVILSSDAGGSRSFLAPGDFGVYHAAAGDQLLYKVDVLDPTSSATEGTVTVSLR